MNLNLAINAVAKLASSIAQLDAPKTETAGPTAGGGKAMLDDDWCGTVPRKFPFPPPPPPWELPGFGAQLGTQVGSEG